MTRRGEKLKKPTYIELTQRIAFYRTQLKKVITRIGQDTQIKLVNEALIESLVKERASLRK